MKKITLTLFISLICLIGFGQQSSIDVQSGGQMRNYIRYTPIGFDSVTENLPLVIVLHGLGGNNTQMVNTGFNQIADTARFHVIYPLGVPNALSQNSWNNGTALSSTTNDVNFISELIDKENQEIGIDLTRVYVCGISMGGIMSFRVALQLNDRIAAMASMVGTMSTPDKNSGLPAQPIPMMQWHGTSDGTVPYDGTALPSLELVQPTLDFWKDANKCGESDSTIYNIPDAMSDGVIVERIVYHASSVGCDSVAMEHWKFTNGTHTWFNGFQNDADGAIEFWNFFRNKTKSNPPPVGVQEIFSVDFEIYPNPSYGQINIASSSQIDKIIIYNMKGQNVFEQKTANNKVKIEPSLSTGIYTVAVYANNKFHSKPIIIR